MAKTTTETAETVEAPATDVAATPEQETGTEESATRVGPMHEAFAEFLNTEFDAGITAEQVFLVTSKRKAFRSTPEYREGVRGALVAAKAAEEQAKQERIAQREQERATKAAEREAAAAKRAEEKAAKDAEKALAKEAKDKEKAEAKAAKEAEKAAAEAAKPVVTKASTAEATDTEAPAEEAPAKSRTKNKAKPAAF